MRLFQQRAEQYLPSNGDTGRIIAKAHIHAIFMETGQDLVEEQLQEGTYLNVRIRINVMNMILYNKA